MNRFVKYTFISLSVIAGIFYSCKKASTDADDVRAVGDMIVLYLDDTIDAFVDTKAVSEVTTIPSNLYWAATSGSGTSETQKFANSYSSVSSSKINTGKYQTATASTYNYYVSNAFLNVGADTYVSASGGTDGTDVICGRVSSSSATPSITMGHIFARTGTLSLSAPSGYTVSGTPSWSIMKSGTNTGTAGTYNLRTGAWSSVSGLTSYTSFNSSSDMYLIPGTYSIKVQFTLTRGNFSKEYTQTGSITVAAGNKYNITASTSSAEAVQVVFTTSVTAWTSASTSFNWDGTGSGGGSSDVTTYRLSSVALASSSISTSGTTTATAYRQRYVNGVATGSEEAISASNITWSTGSSSIATVNSSGTVTGVAAGQTPVTATLKAGAPNYSDYQSVYRTNSSTLTVVAPGVVATEYRNPSVSISASPTQIAATGGSSTLSYSASYEYRYKYSDNTYSSWTSTSGTPTITDNGATGFSRSGATVTASANTGSARSLVCYANFSIGGQSATQQSVTINQSAASITYRLSSSVSFASSPITVATTTTASVTRQRYVNGTASGSAEAVSASNITWSSSDTGKATVNTSGTVTGVAAGEPTITATLKATAPDYSSYESSYRSATGTITVTAASVVATEYRNLSVSISASPTQIPSIGGNSTLSYSASYQYRYKYSNNTYSDWTSTSGTPTITGSATGFTRSGTSVTVAKNTGAARSVRYYADFSIGGQSATQQYVDITQLAPAPDGTEYRNLEVTISSNQTNFTAAGGSATLTFNATYEYRYHYDNDTYGSWTQTSKTPDVTGSATGFTRSGTSVTVASNSGSARSVTYTASCSVGSLSDSASVQLNQAGADVVTYRLLAVTFGNSTIAAGQVTAAFVTRQKYVNGVASGNAESVSSSYINWSSGSTGVATITSYGNVAGVGGGTSVITASLKTTAPDYSSYESSYRSSTGTITVLPYLTVSWASNSSPSWVAQRGQISVSGFDGGASISTVTSSNTSIASVSGSGSTYYIETKAAGNFTITVTGTNGQTGTLNGSATVPYPRFASSSWYVNPDASTARTSTSSTDGIAFNGENIKLYNASSGGTAFTYSTSSGVVTGTQLVTSLASTYLSPSISVGGSYSSKFFTNTSFDNGTYSSDLFLKELPSAGSFISDISSWFTGQIGTVTLTIGGNNGRSVSANIYGVNPFAGWSANSSNYIYEDDYDLLSSYLDTPAYVSSSVRRTNPNCNSMRYGIAIRRNGSWVADNAAIKNAVTISTYNSTQKDFTWLLNSTALSEHIASHIEVYAYVQNIQSSERYYSPVLLKRGIYVHGAIGARMTFNASQTQCTVSAQFAGSEASYGFGTPSGTFIGTSHQNGDPYMNSALPAGTSYQVSGYVGLGDNVYTLVNSNNKTLLPNRVVKGEAPDFIFRNVGTVGVFVEDSDPNLSIYYIAKYGQTVTDSHGEHGMYVLHLLQGIANSSSTLNAGWLAY